MAGFAKRCGDRVERGEFGAGGDVDAKPVGGRRIVEAEERAACPLDFEHLGEEGIVQGPAEADRERIAISLDRLDLTAEAPVAIALAAKAVGIEPAG
jgi:hypothetical protein